jgi:hypothetical protein
MSWSAIWTWKNCESSCSAAISCRPEITHHPDAFERSIFASRKDGDQSPGAPQPQGDDLSPEQRQQLKQKLEALQTVMQGLAAKNAVPAPPGVSPDAHQLPWTVVFVTNADGSFSPRGPIRYNGASYSGPDAKFTHQALFAGVDLTSMQGHNVWAHFDGRILVIDKFQ